MRDNTVNVCISNTNYTKGRGLCSGLHLKAPTKRSDAHGELPKGIDRGQPLSGSNRLYGAFKWKTVQLSNMGKMVE